jgi:hypothetical protein
MCSQRELCTAASMWRITHAYCSIAYLRHSTSSCLSSSCDFNPFVVRRGILICIGEFHANRHVPALNTGSSLIFAPIILHKAYEYVACGVRVLRPFWCGRPG